MVQLKSVSPVHVVPALLLVLFLASNVVSQVSASTSYASHPVAATAESASLAEIAIGNNCTIAGRWSEAVAAYQRAIELDPRSATAYGNLGHAYTQINQLEDAHNSLQRAVALAPKSAVYAYNLGNVQLKLGRAAESVELFQLAIKLRPQFF